MRIWKNLLIQTPWIPIRPSRLQVAFVGEISSKCFFPRDTIAWYKAAVHTMKVTSGAEAVALLCSSGRSNTDLQAALSAAPKKKVPDAALLDEDGRSLPQPSGSEELDDMYLIVREWTCVEPQMEFRGFCYKRKLRAVCQYFTACYFPEIAQNKEAIASTLVKFFKKYIRKSIPFENCVIDFAIMPDGPKVCPPHSQCLLCNPLMYHHSLDNFVAARLSNLIPGSVGPLRKKTKFSFSPHFCSIFAPGPLCSSGWRT